MIKRIRNLIEKYSSSVVGFSKENVDIYENSSSYELSKLLREFEVLRFSMNKSGNYVVWNGYNAFHAEIAFKLPEYSMADTLRGQISTGVGYSSQSYIKTHHKGIHLYAVTATGFYDIDLEKIGIDDIDIREMISDKFKESMLYKNLEKIGIDDIDIGRVY